MNLSIEQQLREMISTISGIPADFSRESHLYLDLGVASIHALQLLTDIEEKFGVSVPDEEFVEATSLGKITDLVSKLTSQPAQG